MSTPQLSTTVASRSNVRLLLGSSKLVLFSPRQRSFLCTLVPYSTVNATTTLVESNNALNDETLRDANNDTLGSHPDNNEMEDCLFLDVYSSKTALEKAGNTYGAAVLVYIHGGGYYASGSKADFTTAGMLQRAASTSPPVVMVALDYLLGAFGFPDSPDDQGNGLANAGLHDQRFVLEWIQKNIHLFGGDPENPFVRLTENSLFSRP